MTTPSFHDERLGTPSETVTALRTMREAAEWLLAVVARIAHEKPADIEPGDVFAYLARLRQMVAIVGRPACERACPSGDRWTAEVAEQVRRHIEHLDETLASYGVVAATGPE